MSKWPMRGHFRHLRFKTFPMTPRTPQGEVFCPLLSSPEHSGVSEDSKSSTFQVLGFTPTLGQSGVATLCDESKTIPPLGALLAPQLDQTNFHMFPNFMFYMLGQELKCLPHIRHGVPMFLCSHPILNCNLNSSSNSHPSKEPILDKTKAFHFLIHIDERTHKEIETYNDFPLGNTNSFILPNL